MVLTRLSGTDALSLHTQSSRTPAHTVAVLLIDASDQLSHQRLHQLLATSLPQLARFRSRLVTKPLGMGQPVWAEIDDYDPSPQIHSATVRAPGGERELADLVTNLITGQQQRRNRLWEAWSINGLAGGRWALAVKMSPALNDGAAGTASLWPRLLSAGPRTESANSLPTEASLGPSPSVAGLMTDVVTEPTAPAASSMSGPVPHTVFNEPLTKRRAVAFASISLADAKAVSDAFGGSITNVVLAAVTLSLRAWLQRYDQVPNDPLLMRMPFELPATHPQRFDKTFGVGQLRIPVHLADPVQVVANLHTATERLNAISDSESSSSTIDLASISSLIPPTLAQVGMQLYSRSGLRQRLQSICHGVVSYIAAEPVPAYCAGVKVVGMHNVAPLADGSGLNIGLISRGDVLDVSVCACPDNVPAVDDIATGIADAIDSLVAAAQKSPRGQGRSVVTEMTSHPVNRSRGRPS
jgi:diacylglycerol O-acyltransferase